MSLNGRFIDGRCGKSGCGLFYPRGIRLFKDIRSPFCDEVGYGGWHVSEIGEEAGKCREESC